MHGGRYPKLAANTLSLERELLAIGFCKDDLR